MYTLYMKKIHFFVVIINVFLFVMTIIRYYTKKRLSGCSYFASGEDRI